MTSRQSPSSSGTGSSASVRKSIRTACPASAAQRGELVEQAVAAPTQSFSTREHSFASSRRSAGSSWSASASSARHSAVESAAEDDRPEPAREVADDRQARRAHGAADGAELRDHAAHERAPALGAAGVGEREGVLLAEVLRAGLDAVAGDRLGRHRHAAVDRERQRQPVVVVGVLADQVHTAGAEGANGISLAGLRPAPLMTPPGVRPDVTAALRVAHPSRRRMTATASGLSSISR